MKRIRYYDILRIMSTAFVIWYHLVIQLAVDGIAPQSALDPFYSNANIHLATLAVSVFFMLSGACQMVSSKENFHLGNYYKKRFLTLLIPFYVTYLLYLVFTALRHPETIAFFRTLPKKRIIYTLLGMDEWISMHGTPTFSLHIGEWFLGCLMVLTILFPAFRLLMLKKRHLFMAAATICFVILSTKYDAFCTRFSIAVPWNMSFFLKGYEYLLGMYLALELPRLPRFLRWAAAAAALVFFISPFRIPGSEALKTTIFALCFFIAFSLSESLLQKENGQFLAKLSSFTYPLFLVHHIVIYEITPAAKPYLAGSGSIAILFLVELAVMTGLALLVQYLSQTIAEKLR